MLKMGRAVMPDAGSTPEEQARGAARSGNEPGLEAFVLMQGYLSVRQWRWHGLRCPQSSQ